MNLYTLNNWLCQNTHLQMGFNGHARFDLYTSCDITQAIICICTYVGRACIIPRVYIYVLANYYTLLKLFE